MRWPPLQTGPCRGEGGEAGTDAGSEAGPELHKQKTAGEDGYLRSSEGSCEMRNCMLGMVSSTAEKFTELPSSPHAGI